MLTDIEIAQAAKLQPIIDIAKKIDIAAKDLISYGHNIAKLSTQAIENIQENTNGKLILDWLGRCAAKNRQKSACLHS
jgi:formate--tetrahydrofolate ligase